MSVPETGCPEISGSLLRVGTTAGQGLSGYIASAVQGKNFRRWLPAYVRQRVARMVGPTYKGRRHLLFALCDHFEPEWQRPSPKVAMARVDAWWREYPRRAARHRDSLGRPPRHSFFFPGEQYAPRYLDRLGALAREGYGEVELHLHHDGDTAQTLRRAIEQYTRLFAEHGHLSREAGSLRYGFIHGNWCLANGRRDGRMCGVDAELPVLHETGCYADFTFPSVPDETQPGIVNQIYWPTGDLNRRRAYETGERARVGKSMPDRLLMIQGPVALSRIKSRRLGVGLEYSAITAADPPIESRIRSWVAANIHVDGRPEWVFVKVYTHGAPETQAAALLGEGWEVLHAGLARVCAERDLSLHYVTAREMYNVAMAAMEGHAGDPAYYYDFRLPKPPVACAV